MAGPTIVTTSPVSGAIGVPTNATISIIFDQEVDTYRLKNGGIVLEGPDESKSIGPGMLALDPPQTDEDEFLASPGFKGIKDVDYTIQRVDGSGVSIDYYDYGDTSGAGELYRTKIILTPKTIFQSLTEYTVYVIGDEDTSDDYDFGITTRSVFDPAKGPNIGIGDVVFYGGYTGSVRQQFFISVTTAGGPGTATYEWWTSTDSIHRTLTSSLGYRLLKEGVRIKFLEGQQYEVGDLFTVWCDVPEFMNGSYKFSFTTSSIEPETLPVSSSIITGISGSSSSSVLSVSTTSPEDRQPFVSPDITSITVTFGASLDLTTVTSSTVTVNGHAVDGSKTGDPEYTETLTTSLSVSAATLTITVDPDEIFENNSIVINLDSTIADTDGNTLGTDYSFFFGTELAPYYAGIRSVRLRLGSLGNSYPDETIAFAIWEGSLEAFAFAPHITTITDQTAYERARQQFVVCYAAWILVSGGIGASAGSVRKQIGDFDVSRSSGSGSNLNTDLKDCISYFQAIMDGGGELNPLHQPQNVVKGDYSTDEPHYGRLWEIPEVPVGNARVLYSGGRRWYKTYLSKLNNSIQRSRWRSDNE
jgi:hypothetical protein